MSATPASEEAPASLGWAAAAWRWIDPRGRGSLGMLLRILLLWNPLACLIFAVALGGDDDLLSAYAVSLTIGTTAVVVGFGLVWLTAFVEAKVLRWRGLEPERRGMAWSMIIAALTLPIGVYGGQVIVSLARGVPLPSLANVSVGVIIGLMTLLAVSLTAAIGSLRRAEHQAELSRRDAENAQLRGKLAVLTAQMNPHLLFNTLNTIASLTRSDPAAAEETTVELATLYRGVLAASSSDTCSLADELDLCRAYMAIEAMRFGERMRYEIRVDVTPSAREIRVPPLLVQPLVENAVKHGLAPQAGGGTVELTARTEGAALVLQVIDDGVGFDATLVRSDRHGLANGRERLRILYGDAAAIRVQARATGGTEVTVRLPVTPPEGA